MAAHQSVASECAAVHHADVQGRVEELIFGEILQETKPKETNTWMGEGEEGCRRDWGGSHSPMGRGQRNTFHSVLLEDQWR